MYIKCHGLYLTNRFHFAVVFQSQRRKTSQRGKTSQRRKTSQRGKTSQRRETSQRGKNTKVAPRAVTDVLTMV